jgi:hypothetical protein
LAEPHALVVAEKEGFVLSDGSAEGPAELVPPEFAFRFAKRILKEVRRIELVIPNELPNVTMELIGSGLHAGIQDRSAGAAKFRPESVGLQFELTHSINRRTENVGCAVQEIYVVAVVVNSIQEKIILGRPRAIGRKPAVGVESPSVGLSPRDTCSEPRQKVKVPAIQWQVIDFR